MSHGLGLLKGLIHAPRPDQRRGFTVDLYYCEAEAIRETYLDEALKDVVLHG
jgi:hypothetical protein